MAVPPAATPEKREGRRGERGERGGRGDRGGRGGREGREGREGRDGRGGRTARGEGAAELPPAAEREERAPRGEGRGEVRGEPRGEGRGEPRGEARGESRRGPRPERAPKADEAVPATQSFVDTDPGAEAPAGDADREGNRRRRRRGGRDRGEGRGEEASVRADGAALLPAAEGPSATVSAEDSTAEAPLAAEASVDTGEREPRGRRRGRGGRDRAREAGDAVPASEGMPVELPAEAAWTATPTAAGTEAVEVVEATEAIEAVTTPAAVAPMAAPVPAPAAATLVPPAPAAQPIRIERYDLPTDELRTLASSAGLEWVLSDAEKIRAVQAAMAAEPLPARVPREPRRQVLVDDGPLVLVETRKDLSQLKLPFEASAG